MPLVEPSTLCRTRTKFAMHRASSTDRGTLPDSMPRLGTNRRTFGGTLRQCSRQHSLPKRDSNIPLCSDRSKTEHHWHLVRRHGPVRTNTAKRYRSIFSRKRNGGSRSKLERKLGAGLHHVRNKVHVNLRRGLNRSTVHASRHILHQDLMSGINRDEGGWTVLEVPNSSLDLLASKRTEADLTQCAETTDGAESPL